MIHRGRDRQARGLVSMPSARTGQEGHFANDVASLFDGTELFDGAIGSCRTYDGCALEYPEDRARIDALLDDWLSGWHGDSVSCLLENVFEQFAEMINLFCMRLFDSVSEGECNVLRSTSEKCLDRRV